MCTDSACNLVLSNCEEFLSQNDVDIVESKSNSESANIRTLSLAIIPGQEILSISVQNCQKVQ
jgi:small nuclear ribonucleoprotein (snRNP)-like protein